jgi:hypothetical protein
MSSFTAPRLLAVLAFVFTRVLTRTVPLRVLRRSLSVAIFACCVAMLWANAASAAVSYTTAGSSYTQNFDTLPNTPTNVSLGNTPLGWTNDNASPGAGNFSILGWNLYHTTAQTEGGFDGHQRMRIGSGTSTTGAFYSFGANSSTERALGDVGASTLSPNGGNLFFGLHLTNNTGQTLTGFTVSFDGEQWQSSGLPTGETMTFGYSFTADQSTWATTGTFTSVPSLSWTAPVHTATAVDGNGVGKVAVSPVTVKNLSWADGTDLWLRWVDPQPSVTDDGMAIDNVSFLSDIFPVPHWTGATSADWNTASNWSTNAVPSSSDTAIFDGASSNTLINLGATRQIGSIQFATGSAAAYTLGNGSATEQFDVAANGGITVASDVTTAQTINAKINALGAISIANSSTSAGLTIGAAVTNNTTLTVDGAGSVTFNGAIGGTGSVTSTMSGTLALNGANTYTGGTSISVPTTVQPVIRVGVSTVGSSGPFGTGAVSISGATAPIIQPTTSDITIANAFSLNAGFFVATAPAAVDPTVRSMTFTGPITPVGGSRVITNNIVAGGVLTFGSAGSPSTISLAGNGLTLQTQPSSGVGGGRTVINDLITGSAAVTVTQLTVQNGVTVVLTNANTYTGLTNIQIGTGGVGNPTLLVNNTSGSGTGTGQVNVKTGFLSGTGTIVPTAPVTLTIPGQVTIGSAGVLAPGDTGIGTLTLDSVSPNGPILDFTTGGTMLAKLNSSFQSDKAALIHGSSNDILFNSTVVNFTDLASGALASGAYALFTSDVAGAYSGLTTDPNGNITSGLTIGAGLSAYLASSLQLVGNTIALNIGTPGDLNNDGHVDAGDYVYWRKNGLPQLEYDVWRANYGSPPGAGSSFSQGGSVPEPASLALVLVSIAGLSAARGRRSNEKRFQNVLSS